MVMYFFFFSSRRRHTRYIGDWSSDVCSSDLPIGFASGLVVWTLANPIGHDSGGAAPTLKIGRASCRERVENAWAGATATKKTGSERSPGDRARNRGGRTCGAGCVAYSVLGTH